MKTTRKSLALVSVSSFGSVLALASGCDSQAGPEYEGEPLAVLSGSVSADVDAPGDWEAVVIWINDESGQDTIVGERVPISGGFPAEYEVALFTPPVEDALISEDGMEIAAGWLTALPAGHDLDSRFPDVFGAAEGKVVFYTDTALEIPEINRIIDPGYHVFDASTDPDSEACQQNSCLSLLDPGDAIDIRIDVGTNLFLPDFT